MAEKVGFEPTCVAAHPLPTDEVVLDGVTQHVSDVQDAGDVGRRQNDDERRFVRVVARREHACLFPRVVPFRLGGLWVEMFVHRCVLVCVVVAAHSKPFKR